MITEDLNEREKVILRSVIQQFILTASPVGSRNISKKYDVGLSPASIRNIMSDLEESGFINHPHTSAGRIPTDKGYRYYVDSLMNATELSNQEKKSIVKQLENFSDETDELLSIASKILSRITNQVACVLYPNVDEGILEKIQLVDLPSNKLLVVISIQSGLIKTITLEMNSDIKEKQLYSVQTLLNERLSGLKISEIRSTVQQRFKDISTDDKPIITLFIDSADKIFKDVKKEDKIVISGASNLLRQPEFENKNSFQSIVELIENKNVIIHIFDKACELQIEKVFVTIGSENKSQKLEDYSLIIKEYKAGELNGTLGIIGPKRMEYSKIISIVDYISKILTNFLSNQS